MTTQLNAANVMASMVQRADAPGGVVVIDRVLQILAARRARQLDMDACKRLNVELCARGIYLSLSDLDDALWLSGVLEAERLGLLDRIAALRESLAAIVRCLEEARDGDGIREEHIEAHFSAKAAIARADVAADNARDEVQELLAKASEVPGLTATVDELRHAVVTALREIERCDHEAAKRALREALPALPVASTDHQGDTE